MTVLAPSPGEFHNREELISVVFESRRSTTALIHTLKTEGLQLRVSNVKRMEHIESHHAQPGEANLDATVRPSTSPAMVTPVTDQDSCSKAQSLLNSDQAFDSSQRTFARSQSSWSFLEGS